MKKKRTLKMQEVLALAHSKGYEVDARITEENGWIRVRVKSIAYKGKKTTYKGSSGNTALRSMLGKKESKKATESRRRSAQMYATRKNPNSKKRRAIGAEQLSTRELSKIKRINRRLMKQGKTERVSLPNARRRKTREGEEELIASLNRTEEHYEGWVYPANLGPWSAFCGQRDLMLTKAVIDSLVEEIDGRWVWKDDRRITDEYFHRLTMFLYSQAVKQQLATEEGTIRVDRIASESLKKHIITKTKKSKKSKKK